MPDRISEYYLIVGTFRDQLPDRIDKIQQAVDSIRNLPFTEEDLVAAIALLSIGLGAGKELADIKL